MVENGKSGGSLAPPEGGLHTLAPVSLVVVDEREGQRDVEGVGPARGRRPLPGLKGDGEVHPGRRTLGLETLDEVLAEYLAQHGLEGQVHADGPVRAAWRETCSLRGGSGCKERWESFLFGEGRYLKLCRAPSVFPVAARSGEPSGLRFLRHSLPQYICPLRPKQNSEISEFLDLTGQIMALPFDSPLWKQPWCFCHNVNVLICLILREAKGESKKTWAGK